MRAWDTHGVARGPQKHGLRPQALRRATRDTDGQTKLGAERVVILKKVFERGGWSSPSVLDSYASNRNSAAGPATGAGVRDTGPRGQGGHGAGPRSRHDTCMCHRPVRQPHGGHACSVFTTCTGTVGCHTTTFRPTAGGAHDGSPETAAELKRSHGLVRSQHAASWHKAAPASVAMLA